MPSLNLEHQLHRRGRTLIAGVDEVGRGALAGPVMAGAVILPPDLDPSAPWLEGIDDSKKLTPQQREDAAREIHQNALSVSIGEATSEEIDELGIVPRHPPGDGQSRPRSLPPTATPASGLPDSGRVRPARHPRHPRRRNQLLHRRRRHRRQGCPRQPHGRSRHPMAGIRPYTPTRATAPAPTCGSFTASAPAPIHRFTFAPVRKTRLFHPAPKPCLPQKAV